MKKSYNQKIITVQEFDSFSAKLLYDTLKKLSEEKKYITIALSGGSTPLPIFNLLKGYGLKWDYFNFFMVDERFVPINSPLSNYGNIEKVFFSEVSCSRYSMVLDNYSIEECVENYQNLIYSKVPIGENNFPKFDLILLGIGDDGHTASLFADTEGLNESNKIVIKNTVPQLETERITLTYPVILNASKIMIFAKGEPKYKVLKKINERKGDMYPIAKILKSKVDKTLILGMN